jgi:tRNA(Arg) A34 adenosine deaminase TadA
MIVIPESMALPTKFGGQMPRWMRMKFKKDQGLIIPDLNGQMEYAIELAAMNIRVRRRIKRGGPFGAAVFEVATGRLLAGAANRVDDLCMCGAHAESLLMDLLQQALGFYSLRDPRLPRLRMVSSAAMCNACFGKYCWGGPIEFASAATTQDVETDTIFREGLLHPEWRKFLHDDGITLYEEILRSKSRRVLQRYTKSGGLMYNAT